jgi:hypothetical protein
MNEESNVCIKNCGFKNSIRPLSWKVKVVAVPQHHGVKMYLEADVKLPVFLVLSLDGGEGAPELIWMH